MRNVPIEKLREEQGLLREAFGVLAPGKRPGSSSRNALTQAGSRPTIGIPALKAGASAANVRSQSFLARSSIPQSYNGRPQHRMRSGIVTV